MSSRNEQNISHNNDLFAFSLARVLNETFLIFIVSKKRLEVI